MGSRDGSQILDVIPRELHLRALESPRLRLSMPQTPREITREDSLPQTPRTNQVMKDKRFCDVLDLCLTQLRTRVVAEYHSEGAEPISARFDVALPPASKFRPRANDFLEAASATSSESSNGPVKESLSKNSIKDSMISASMNTSMSSAGLNNQKLVLQKWCKLCSLIMSPKARLALTSAFQVHEAWAHYLDVLRFNHGNSQSVYAIAKTKIVAQRSSENGLRTSPLLQIPISLPHVAWRVVTCACLLYDAVALPFNASFDIEDSSVHIIFLCLTHVFFVLDIFMNFKLGWETPEGVEMRPRGIASLYARSWLAFDVLLVFFDWLVFALDVIAFSSKSSDVRLLRLMRLLRLLKMHRMLRGPILYISTLAPVTSELVESSLGYLLYVHFSACAWFAVKTSVDEMWGNGCPSKEIAYCYFTVLHWALAQLHGAGSGSYSTSLEWIFSATSLLVGMLLFAILLTQVTAAAASLKATSLKATSLRQRCIAYVRKRHLSDGLSYRLLRYVSTGGAISIGKSVKEETDLLQSFPLLLRGEALYESRKRLISCVSFINDLEYISKQLLMQLCTDALDFTIALSGELIFTLGDTATHWRTVDSGRLLYRFQQEDAWNTISQRLMTRPFLTRPRRTGTLQSKTLHLHRESFDENTGRYRVSVGTNISEMAMWTSWEHAGDLFAIEDCVLLQMTLGGFCRTLAIRYEACLLAAWYAQQYVTELNSRTYDMSDILQISPCFQDEDDERDDKLPHEISHLVFLSHYKVEAGTEATLMQDALEQMIVRENVDMSRMEACVFLDSENLSRLHDLKDHVIGSDNLVLLLTPGVLLRPWCILEMVTAMENDVQIVPVEIQRPGMKFTYPDEKFYKSLREGALLNRLDLGLLAKERITLADVENAFRFVFRQIALPFSPHKSKNIREAELKDIMTRCMSEKDKSGWGTYRGTTSSVGLPSRMLHSQS